MLLRHSVSLVDAPEPRTWCVCCARTVVRRLTVFSRIGHSGRHAADCRSLRLTQGPSFCLPTRHGSGAICLQCGPCVTHRVPHSSLLISGSERRVCSLYLPLHCLWMCGGRGLVPRLFSGFPFSLICVSRDRARVHLLLLVLPLSRRPVWEV